jgi:hypothetical protein
MLLRLIRKLPDTETLVEWVRGSKWLAEASLEVRYNVLSYISAALMRWNVRHGYAPFDDGLPNEPDKPFIIIRKILQAKNEIIASRNTKRDLGKRK